MLPKNGSFWLTGIFLPIDSHHDIYKGTRLAWIHVRRSYVGAQYIAPDPDAHLTP
jgi:hypothetical protein